MQTNSHEIKLVPRPVQDTSDKQAPNGYRVRVPRARRYDICAALRYRVRGKKEWYEGVMKNMSISGVLLSTPHSLPLEAIIEMRFSLPVLISGESAAEVLCRGSVVRTSKGNLSDGESIVAARVTRSRFLRQER